MTTLKRMLLILALGLSTISSVYAADPIWRSVFDWYKGEGTTPLAACNNAVANFNKTRTLPESIVRVTAIEKSSTSIGVYRCFWCQGTGTCPKESFSAATDTNACPPGTIYNDTIDKCTNDWQKGLPATACSSSYAGSLIDFSIGNKFHIEHDYQGSGLQFSRTYNSIDGIWRHSYSTSLRISSPYVAMIFNDGREVLFHTPGDTPIPPEGEQGTLHKLSDKWIYNSNKGEIFHFTPLGKLSQIESPSSNIKITYSDNKMVIRDHANNQITLAINEHDQPASAQAEGWQIGYTYDANGNLIVSTRHEGNLALSRHYHYEDTRFKNLLTGITDERGVRVARWLYDDQGRIISSESADGLERVSIFYNLDKSVAVKNSLDRMTVYKYALINKVNRVIEIQGEPSPNCPSSNSKYYYLSSGALSKYINDRGHATNFYYNSRGLEVQRQEARGTPQARTITTEWHPSLLLPVAITEPRRITRYQYDDQGRQLSRTIEAR